DLIVGIKKSLILNWNADIVYLHESKLDGGVKDMIKELWGGRWVKYVCLQASGTRGGILMLWDSRSWRGEVLEIGSYTLTCKFETLLQDYKCHITGVYAPTCRFERKHVWEEIRVVRSLFEDHGQHGSFGFTNRKGSFTWFKGDNNNAVSRIDRILISKEWDDSFSKIKQPDYILGCKLKALKSKLKKWSNTSLGNLRIQKLQILNELAILD
ncbi:hypothetical protein H5410_035040, partial [Solanum commersonii]